MHIEINQPRCEGHGRCIEWVPEVFGYDDVTNRAYVLPDADVDAHRSAIKQAAEGCPELAILLSE
ncbi:MULTISPECIES: ferredoxin [unclassified Streptomyces]|uniref:ferredoxin n=1 Tax=unclassified Streptomyces TaxID=2593676 RepID=UPI003D94D619